MGEGSYRGTIADPPANRKAEAGARRAPGGAWGQLSEEARDELTRPLGVESGRTGSPGEDQLQGQPDHRDLRQGGSRLPEPGEEPAEGGGEPGTIERPRVRARTTRSPTRERWLDLPRSRGERIESRRTRPGGPWPGRRRPRIRWSREELAETEGGSRESDTNSEGNDHTGRRITLGREMSKRANQGGSEPWEDRG